MARASARWSGASTQAREARAGARRPARVAPSACHWSVTGAGRRARETSALRSGAGAGVGCQAGTAPGSKPRASASARKPCWGWSAAPGSSAPRRSQTWAGSVGSRPGRTRAPCGRRATAAMKARVAPREPVEPATMTGCPGGLAAQAAARAWAAARRRPWPSAGPAASSQGVMRARKRRLRCQCRACSAGSTRAKAAGSRPSPCISSRSSARLSASSKAAVPAARWGSASARAATRRASSSWRRRAGTAGGSAGVSGSSASSARVRMRGRRRAGPSARTAWRVRAARRVLSQNLDAGDRLGRLAGEAGVEAGGERAGEVGAGGEGEDARAVARGEEAGHARRASASAMPSGRPTSTQPPGWTVASRRCRARSAFQTGLREKTRSGKAARAAGSMIWAPA